MPKIDLTGQQFGELTVIEDSGKRANDGSILWRCKCSCGNEDYLTTGTELKRKGPRAKTHCSNTIHQVKDLTGQRFGSLEVISINKESLGSKKITWFCKCHNCDREALVCVRGNDLTMGKSQTCGCGHNTSKGSQKIELLLRQNKIPFKSEYSFEDLKNPVTNQKLRFDFCIEKDNQLTLIEYDGEQHFYYNNGEKTWNNETKFKDTKYRDSLKNEYCKNNNIPLYRIPYFKIDEIEQVQDIFKPEFLI